MSTEIVIAVIGIVGVCAGSIISAGCQYWFQERPRQRADEERKKEAAEKNARKSEIQLAEV